MNYADVRMLDDSLNNLGDTFLKQRMMKAEQGRYDQEQTRLQQNASVEQDLQRQRLGIEQQNAKSMDAARTQKESPLFKWTGEDGVDYAAHSAQDFAQLVQQHPARKEDDGTHTLELSGTDENGVTVRQHIKVPADSGDTGKQTAAGLVKNFMEFSGAKPKAQKQTPWERNTALYNQQLQQAQNAETPEEKALYQGQAELTKSWLDKQGKFAPPKGVEPSITEVEKQVPSPLGGTNAPSVLRTTTTRKPLNIGDSGLPNLAPKAAPTPAAKIIPPGAIKLLQSNPGMWKDFEAKYGQGSSANYLP